MQYSFDWRFSFEMQEEILTAQGTFALARVTRVLHTPLEELLSVSFLKTMGLKQLRT